MEMEVQIYFDAEKLLAELRKGEVVKKIKDKLQAMFLLLAIFTVPILIGHSWSPLPVGIFGETYQSVEHGPAFVVGVDNYSFPNFDWPNREVARRSVAAHEFPLWNPYSSLGYPLAGQTQTQVFFPLEILERHLGSVGWSYVFCFKVIAAFFGAFLLLDNFVKHRVAKLFGALFYSTSAYFIWFSSIPAFINGAMMVPFVFWASARICNSEKHPDQFLNGLLMGLMAGLMLLTGQPQIVALTFLGAAGLITFHCAQNIHFDKGFSSKFHYVSLMKAAFVAVPIALVIASPQILLTVEALRNGYSIHSAGAYRAAGTSPLNFTISFWPYLLGQPMAPWDQTLYPASLNWEAFPVTVGVVGAFCISLGVAAILSGLKAISIQYRRNIRSVFLLLIGVYLVIILGTIGYPTIWVLPGLNRINLPRYSAPMVALIFSVLLSVGMERRPSRREILIASGIGFVFLILCLSIVLSNLPMKMDFVDAQYLSKSLLIGIGGFLMPLSVLVISVFQLEKRGISFSNFRYILITLMGAELASFARYGFDVDAEIIRLTLMFFVGLILVLAIYQGRSMRFGLLFLSVLVAMQISMLLKFSEHKMVIAVEPKDNPPELIVKLKEVMGRNPTSRVMTVDNALSPNFSNIWGISQLESLAPVQVKRTAELIFEKLSDGAPLNYTLPVAWTGFKNDAGYLSWDKYFLKRKIYNLMAVRFLIDEKNGYLSHSRADGVELVWQGERYSIYEDMHAKPRAYFLTNVTQNIDDISDLTDAALQVESEISVGIKTPNSLQIKFSSGSRDRVLVVADAYFPGWVAYVNGQKREVVRVGDFRGVVVGPLDNDVNFVYESRWIDVLAFFSILFMIGISVFISIRFAFVPYHFSRY